MKLNEIIEKDKDGWFVTSTHPTLGDAEFKLHVLSGPYSTEEEANDWAKEEHLTRYLIKHGKMSSSHHFIAIKESEQLDEIKLKHALAGAALATGLATGAVHKHDVEQAKTQVTAAQKSAQEKVNKAEAVAKAAKSLAERERQAIVKLTDIVLDKYKISPDKAQEIVELTKKHEKDVFPKAADLLAIIGIESSFNPAAKSHLKHDKAIGLTQVRPKIWGIHVKDLRGNLDKQVELSADILSKYYRKLGSKDKAVHAYNVGLTNVRHGTGLNPAYLQKWKTELKRYTT